MKTSRLSAQVCRRREPGAGRGHAEGETGESDGDARRRGRPGRRRRPASPSRPSRSGSPCLRELSVLPRRRTVRSRLPRRGLVRSCALALVRAGGTPTIRVKCRLRCGWSVKPTATAASAGAVPASSSRRARRTRASVSQVCGGIPYVSGRPAAARRGWCPARRRASPAWAARPSAPPGRPARVPRSARPPWAPPAPEAPRRCGRAAGHHHPQQRCRRPARCPPRPPVHLVIEGDRVRVLEHRTRRSPGCRGSPWSRRRSRRPPRAPGRASRTASPREPPRAPVCGVSGLISASAARPRVLIGAPMAEDLHALRRSRR